MKSFVLIRAVTSDGRCWEDVMVWHRRSADDVRGMYRRLNAGSGNVTWEGAAGQERMLRQRCIHGTYGKRCSPVTETLSFHDTDPVRAGAVVNAADVQLAA